MCWNIHRFNCSNLLLCPFLILTPPPPKKIPILDRRTPRPCPICWPLGLMSVLATNGSTVRWLRWYFLLNATWFLCGQGCGWPILVGTEQANWATAVWQHWRGGLEGERGVSRVAGASNRTCPEVTSAGTPQYQTQNTRALCVCSVYPTGCVNTEMAHLRRWQLWPPLAKQWHVSGCFRWTQHLTNIWRLYAAQTNKFTVLASAHSDRCRESHTFDVGSRELFTWQRVAVKVKGG